ncbi:hypothetical protein Ddc_19576 [Ditylenchus destructor]|nr:hypothetical protein Ddc_19576 [Ditylenchus destructor]
MQAQSMTTHELTRTCAYCLSLPFGESQAMSYSHTKKNCPRLVMLTPCKYCDLPHGGAENYTKSPCPKKPRILLTLNNDNDLQTTNK